MSILELANAALEKIHADKRAEPRRGITTDDVLRVFPGAKVVEIRTHETKLQPLPCRYCGGQMSERLKQRRNVLTCGRCGRKR